jgi:hypothetical protein
MNESHSNKLRNIATGDAARQDNPFGTAAVATRAAGATANTDQQRAIAEVQAALFIARSNPRDPIAAMDKILNECTRQGLAETAVYQYARGGTAISGPSIRLAETIARQWGNIQYGVRELDQRHGESVVQAYAWDVETNTRRETTFTVPHARDTKQGRKELNDTRDIYEIVANMGARRLRACILGVVPGDVIEAAVAQCELTLKAKADTSPEAMQKMVEAFGQFGVVRSQIEKRIQRRLDAITSAQVVGLKKVYASLRDGMSAVGDWFDPADDGPEVNVPPPRGAAEPPPAAPAPDQDGLGGPGFDDPAAGAAPIPPTAGEAAQGPASAPDGHQDFLADMDRGAAAMEKEQRAAAGSLPTGRKPK